MDEKEQLCHCCQTIVDKNEIVYIYCVMVETEAMLYWIGLVNLFENLGDYIMTKNYHLSASQILLLRPDVVKEYLEHKYGGEKVKDWYLERYAICSECFKEYITLAPLI